MDYLTPDFDADNGYGFYKTGGLVNEDAVFAYAVEKTLRVEKQVADDHDDPGGRTVWGFASRSHGDVTYLSRGAATSKYWSEYWLAPKINQVAAINPSIGIKLFDLAVNCGQQTAVKMLQRAVNVVCTGTVPASRAAKWRQVVARITRRKPLKVDGIIGPVTLSVINACPYMPALLMALRGEAYIYYKKGKPLFIPGWLDRLGQ